IWIVFSMEPDGITKAWTRKVLRTRAMSTATPTRRGISLIAERRRRRLILRWSLRRSARPRMAAPPAARRVPVGSRLSATWSETPRGLPRLPMGTVRGGHTRVGGGTPQPGPVARGPGDPVGPADHVIDGDHAAAGGPQVVAGVAGVAAVVAEEEQ